MPGPDNNLEFFCRICGSNHPIENILDHHREYHLYVDFKDAIGFVASDVNQTIYFQCKKCGMRFDRLDEFKIHMLEVSRFQLPPIHCQSLVNSNSERSVGKFSFFLVFLFFLLS